MNKRLVNEYYTIPLLPSVANAIGLNEALVLQQLHFFTIAPDDWLPRFVGRENRVGRDWLKVSIRKWQRRVFTWWTRQTVANIFDSLEELELIVTLKQPGKTTWYAVDYEALSKKLDTRVYKDRARKKENPYGFSSASTPTATTREVHNG